MAKYAPTTLASGFNITLLNAELASIASAIDRLWSLYGDAPNSAQSPLDMNSKRIINLPAPASGSDAARFSDIPSTVSTTTTAAVNISLADSGNLFASTNVEGALQEAVVTGAVNQTIGGMKTFSSVPSIPITDTGGTITATTVEGALQELSAAGYVTAGHLGTNAVTPIKLATAAVASGLPMVNGILVASVNASALTVAIKTLAGTDPSATDPVYVAFRNATATSGDFTILTLTAATSVVVPSGADLGATNNTAFRIWLVAFNDAGTFRLGVINCLAGTQIYALGGYAVASSTILNNSSDSPHVFYSAAAVTSKPYTILGHFSYEAGLATTGTYNIVPTRSSLFRLGMPLPGDPVQQLRASTGAVNTGTTPIPADNSIPLIAEGDQYQTLTITPSSAANVLEVAASTALCNSAVSEVVAVLFQDSSAALAAVVGDCNATLPVALTMLYRQLAGTGSSTTFKIRGGGASGTTTFNGVGGTVRYGSILNSYLLVRELQT